MAHHYYYSIEDLENLIPFERDIYVGMVKDYVETQNQHGNNN